MVLFDIFLLYEKITKLFAPMGVRVAIFSRCQQVISEQLGFDAYFNFFLPVGIIEYKPGITVFVFVENYGRLWRVPNA